MNISDFQQWVLNKKIAVLGAGISNRPLISILLRAGAKVVVFDRQEESVFTEFKEELKAENLECSWSLGAGYLEALHGFDIIFRTPIVMPYQEQILAEKRRGAVITSEMEVFLQLCPAEVFAITGSDGKTTTSTLAAKILEAQGYTTWLGGNIGQPLLQYLSEIKSEDKVVIELSSFQLISMSISPKNSLITNLSPNHLDIHKSYREYYHAKKNIFLHQDFSGRFVANGEDELVSSFIPETKGNVLWTVCRPYGEQPLFGLDGNTLFYQAFPKSKKEALLSREDLLLPGRYNALNVLSALALTWHSIDFNRVRDAITSFSGVEHRLEFVREYNGVKIYNSSIDSSPNRTLNSLSAFREQGFEVVLIAGGKDKNLQYEKLGEMIVASTKGAYLCGQNARLIHSSIAEALDDLPDKDQGYPYVILNSYREALREALNHTDHGDVILFSPAGTSFDSFKNFEERGRYFKTLVNELLS